MRNAVRQLPERGASYDARSARDDSSIPAHAVVHKDSAVEILAANARIVLDGSSGTIDIGVAGDIWLKVRIDGRVGWIHTQEDFVAIGLQPGD